MLDPYSQSGDRADERRRMVDEQIRSRGVRDPAVLEAMNAVPRELFVPPEFADAAYDDRALPIEHSQTISQPFIVAYMTEQLEVTPDSIVLEVGTGSGYQTAILAKLAAHVYSVERIDDLRRLAETRLASLGLTNVTLHTGDGTLGLAEFAPYDRIIVTAAALDAPASLLDQLKEGGRMIIPLGETRDEQSLVQIDKTEEGLVETALLPVRFVPLVHGRVKRD